MLSAGLDMLLSSRKKVQRRSDAGPRGRRISPTPRQSSRLRDNAADEAAVVLDHAAVDVAELPRDRVVAEQRADVRLVLDEQLGIFAAVEEADFDHRRLVGAAGALVVG